MLMPCERLHLLQSADSKGVSPIMAIGDEVLNKFTQDKHEDNPTTNGRRLRVGICACLTLIWSPVLI